MKSARNIIQNDWQLTYEGKSVLQQLYPAHRRLLGVLEAPNLQPEVNEVSYKLFFTGKCGIGKTGTIAYLSGNQCPKTHLDTYGIYKTDIYWPTKIWDKIVLFKLQCWEAGDNGIKKFSHILPSCRDRADAIVFLFSFMDLNSFQNLPEDISKLVKKQTDQPAIILIGTRYNSTMEMDVSANHIKEIEKKYHLKILRIKNYLLDDSTDADQVRCNLNSICEHLWLRDEEYILRQPSFAESCSQ